MQKQKILWADDEIELLKPHILFLEKRGYALTAVNSGADAIECCEQHHYDIVFLDENMPGMSGVETLGQIKTLRPTLPVVMITKSEEEYIMEEAIGAKIADYLIKPINPNQILLAVKKILDKKRIVSEKTNASYQQDFRAISMAFGESLSFADWAEIHKKLVYWDLAINQTENRSMIEVLEMQKAEANVNFAKFIKKNYEHWLDETGEANASRPLLSHELFKKKVLPNLKTQTQSTFFILIDNMRFDQWKTIEPIVAQYFNICEEVAYCSILPTTTAFARNAIFSGLLPLEISKKYPELWVGEEEEGSKNSHEAELLEKQLKRYGLGDLRFSYHKVVHTNQGKQVLDEIHNLINNHTLNVIVYNFVDMLSHARTDTQMIRELTPDEPAYRSLTASWFRHAPLLDTLKVLAEKKANLILTTDHGTIRTRHPQKIVGDKDTNTNLRYKQGKNLKYTPKNVLAVSKPEKFHLPQKSISERYVFATEDHFFAYPNNYTYYVKYYKDTFQHGGISLEEMIIPFVSLSAK